MAVKVCQGGRRDIKKPWGVRKDRGRWVQVLGMTEGDRGTKNEGDL